MRRLGGLLQVVPAAVIALTQSEAWLLRVAIVLFVCMVGFCLVIASKVKESTQVANAANTLATSLDERTAALEEKLRPKG